jgi:hypothetical protein
MPEVMPDWISYAIASVAICCSGVCITYLARRFMVDAAKTAIREIREEDAKSEESETEPKVIL